MLHHALPIRDEVKAFIDFCAHEYALCQQRGEALRASNPDRDIFTLGFIVWGREYVDNFLRYGMRSMLSEGNLPTLRSQGQVVFSIVTDVAGEAQIRQHPVFAQMCALGDVVFITMAESITGILRSGHLVRNFYVLYGMLDHCSIYFAQGARSHLFMIPVDAIVADGSLPNMANYRHEGFECCGGGNIVANTETFLPALDGLFGADGPISISTEELASLAVKHAHHYFTSQIIAKENQDFGKHPRELFWPVAGGVEIHSVFIHPLFTTASGLAKYQRRHFANIDYGMIPRMFAGSASIKIIDDPRKAYVNNYTAANRLYETTGMPFAQEDFIRSHGWSYPVQKSLFTRAQRLPCRLEGWTPYRDVATDVQEINLEFAEEEPPSSLATTDLTIIMPTFNRPALCRAQVQFLRRTKFRHRVIVGGLERTARSRTAADLSWADRISAVRPRDAAERESGCRSAFRHDAIRGHDRRRRCQLPVRDRRLLGFPARQPRPCGRPGLRAQRHHDPGGVRHPERAVVHGGDIGKHAAQAPLRAHASVSAVLPGRVAHRRILAGTRCGKPRRRAVLQGTRLYRHGGCPRKIQAAADDLYAARRRGVAYAGVERPSVYWFLSNTSTFFEGYVQYRNRLAAFLKDLQKREEQLDESTSAQNDKTPEELTHLLDIIHASYFGREMDTGMINHTARVLLGDAIKPLKFEGSKWHDDPIGPADLVHPAGREGRRYVWRKEVLKAEPRSEITISGEEIAHVEAVLDQYVPPEPGRAPLVSILEAADFPAVAENVSQVASVENASIDIDDGQVIRFAELKRYGLHRLTLRVADRRPKETARWSVKVKADGCTRVKFELHDDGARKYGMCIVDLETGEVDQGGALALADMVSLPDGHLEVDLALPWTAESQSHFSITLLDRGNSLVHPGDTKGRSR